MAPSAPPPPKRSQRAADALLDAPALAKKRSRHVAATSALLNGFPASKTAAGRRPPSHGSNPYAQKARPSGAAATGGASGAKRPMTHSGARGTNGGGGGVAGVGRANPQPSSSLFDRRNSRDRVSKSAAPSTGTDRNLLAMLDGPRKRKPQAALANRGNQNNKVRARPASQSMLPETVAEKRRKTMGGASRYLDDSGSGVLVAPPPMPSYGISHGRDDGRRSEANAAGPKPRKRMSSHTSYSTKDCGKKKTVSRKDDARELGGGSKCRNEEKAERRGNTRKSGVSSTRVDARDVAPAVAAPRGVALQTSDARASAMNDAAMASSDGRGGQEVTLVCNPRQRRSAPYEKEAPANDVSQVMDSIEMLEEEPDLTPSLLRDGSTTTSTSKSTLSVATAAHRKKVNKLSVVTAATSLDDAMPADEELMALPLLGIGKSKRASATNKPRRDGAFRGSSLSSGRRFSSHSSGRPKDNALDRQVANKDETSVDGSGTNRASRAREGNDAMQSDEGAVEGDLTKGGNDAGTSHELNDDAFDADAYGDDDDDTEDTKASKHAEWYDPEEHMAIQKEASANNASADNKRSSKSKKPSGGINDNFVRQDLRNGAGSCRGARNLKRVNKQKLWRAQHRFGMSDPVVTGDGGDGGNGGHGGMDQRGSQYGSKYGSRSGKRGPTNSSSGGDLKCFASTKNAGVDPLDDFVDGVFSKRCGDDEANLADGDEEECGGGSNGRKKNEPTRQRSERAPTRDEGVPLCTRHQRPCKLLTVKRNNKGNRGRKFYVCPMPRGEQCDFFKWEEDTIEATQKALLKSSSNSGFIARQVAASRTRFKELTVPELRAEAKKRGLKSTGKKDQILTRLLIWVRDEIANSVEPDSPGKDKTNVLDITAEGNDDTDPSDADLTKEVDAAGDGDGDNDDGVECKEPAKEPAADTTKFIELSDDDESDDESSYDDDATDGGESSCDELELFPEGSKKHATSTATDDGSKPDTPLHDSLLKYFGHSAFREGQEWAVRRCLSHRKTLLVAPTGQGKSLCYALPAALMEGICLVVSPLISLMQDQLRQLPPKIPAATLSGSMTQSQMALIVDDVLRGRYRVLFVSPERLASAAFRRLVRPRYDVGTGKYERRFPTVSLLCVDEAHCLSQWGHNFRPSYLRVRSLLPLIEPRSVLALTATAGPMVVRDICNTLGIPFDGRSLGSGDEVSLPSTVESSKADLSDKHAGDGVRVLNCDRDNIDVSSFILQSSDERRYLLHKILKDGKKDGSERPRKLPIEEGCLSRGSVIVYVWRQKDTEIVAEQLNGAGIHGGVVCYHGGMDSANRSRAQSKFMRGKARICVATVAFGLGINKPDIRGIIHLCLPPSPEHYLQEIGRAGRDGRPAMAIALPLAEEFTSRHSLAHSDRLSRDQLEVVFLRLQKSVDEALSDIPPEAGIDLSADRLFVDGIHVAMPVMQTVDASDCKEESIETIFSLLEGGEESGRSSGPSLLSVEGYLPDVATVTLKKRSLDKLEKMEQIALSISKCGTRVDGPNNEQPHNQEDVNANNNPYNKYRGNFGGTAMEKGFYAYSFGTYKFSIIRCARCMGPNTEPRHVYAALRRLQGNGELELVLDTTANGRAMHLRMKQDGIHLFRMRGAGNVSALGEAGIDDDVKAIVANLSKQFSAKEKVSVGKVESMYEIMHRVSCKQDDEDDEDLSCEEEDNCNGSDETKKSRRLALFQKLVQNYFHNGSVDKENSNKLGALSSENRLPLTRQVAPNRAPNFIKDFPLRNLRLLTCLSADVTLLMQALALRRQEQMPAAVRVAEPESADYRDLCLSKILHSIDAPRAPILEWYNHILWGKYRSYSFSSVVGAVKKTFDNA